MTISAVVLALSIFLMMMLYNIPSEPIQVHIRCLYDLRCGLQDAVQHGILGNVRNHGAHIYTVGHLFNAHRIHHVHPFGIRFHLLRYGIPEGVRILAHRRNGSGILPRCVSWQFGCL